MGAKAFALKFDTAPIRPVIAPEAAHPGQGAAATGPEPIRSVMLAQLRAAIARIEDRAPRLAVGVSPLPPADHVVARPRSGHPGRLRFGIPELDLALDPGPGGGLPAAALHEVRAAESGEAASAIGFALLLAGLAAGFSRPVFWIAQETAQTEVGSLYGPGLAGLGLDPGLLVRIRAHRLAEALWAAGEVAAAGAGPCLLEIRGNPARADLAFTRRLALRARATGLPVIVLRQSGQEEASAAASRLAVRPAASETGPPDGPGAAARWLGPAAFAVTIEKCRGGRAGSPDSADPFLLEWNCHERRFVAIGPGTSARARSDDRTPAGRTPVAPLPFARSASAGDGPADARPPWPALALRRA
jgi:protein ImuA